MLMRAAALERTNLTAFVLNTAIKAAETAIERDEAVYLSVRDSQKVMDLLDAPPAPNAKLIAAALVLKEQ